jgi:hypothetical protein
VSEELGNVVDPDIQPQEQAQAEPEPQPQAGQAEQEPQEHGDPIAAIVALRKEVQSLKPLAQKAQQLEQELNEARPYAEFLRANPQLLQRSEPTPQPQVQPQDDPELIELAKTLELYNPQTGQPDTARAAKIRDFNQKTAQQIAQQAIAPVQERTYEQQAAQNLHNIANTYRDADGRTIETEYLTKAVQTITASLPKNEALRVLADPTVAQVVGLVAQGLQAQGRKTPPKAPDAPPLHIESAGGATDVPLSDGSRRLARMVGRSEKEWTESAKRYVPGRSNSLE